jgi:hypothetical protein
VPTADGTASPAQPFGLPGHPLRTRTKGWPSLPRFVSCVRTIPPRFTHHFPVAESPPRRLSKCPTEINTPDAPFFDAFDPVAP